MEKKDIQVGGGVSWFDLGASGTILFVSIQTLPPEHLRACVHSVYVSMLILEGSSNLLDRFIFTAVGDAVVDVVGIMAVHVCGLDSASVSAFCPLEVLRLKSAAEGSIPTSNKSSVFP